MNLAINAGESAWNQRKGIWNKYGDKVLLGYEYRMCIKLATADTPEKGIKDAFQRICVDLQYSRYSRTIWFHDIPPCYRLWVWEKDIDQAKTDLQLNQA